MEGSRRSDSYHCNGEVVREQEVSEIHVLGGYHRGIDCDLLWDCRYCSWSIAGLDFLLLVDK